jgi:CYTH domain-containing protein
MTDGPVLPILQAHPEKYGYVERERCYLLRRLPPGLTAQSEHRRITDHYLSGTEIRLRHVSRPATGEDLWKLTQKVRPVSTDGTSVFTTTFYLSEREHALLRSLPGRPIVKDRYPFDHGGRRYGIDVFHGPLTGLILAETECGSEEELAALTRPDFAAVDVSHDEAFTGGALAALTLMAAQVLWGQRFRGGEE